MKIEVALENGMLADRFGKYAPAQDRGGHGVSKRSFPFVVSDVPQGARALAWVFYDWDSVPVCGLPWIHWDAWLGFADGAVPARVEIPEDASRQGLAGLHEGRTSGRDAKGAFGVGYEGPCPPDKDHVYTLHVVALDAEPAGLEAPFWANELVAACRGHIVDGAKALLPSRA